MKEAVKCFMDQDYEDRELVVLNNHPVALVIDLPKVRVINESGYGSLGACRNRLLEEVGEGFVRTWDDDDLYLPWAISQGVGEIGDAPAWKPTYSWFSTKNSNYSLQGNAMEASVTYRADVVKKYGYRNSGGDEHVPLLEGIEIEGGMGEKDMGGRASYVYRWDNGEWHISGSLGSARSLEDRTADWISRNDDHGSGVPLVPEFVKDYYTEIAEAARGLI